MSKKIPTPHDVFFKRCWGKKNVARDFLKATLPENLVLMAEWSSFELCSENLVGEDLDLHMVDVLYRVKFKNRQGYMFQLIEAQSTVDRFMPLRIMMYVLKLIERHRKNCKSKYLPMVVVTVLYNGEAKYNGPRCFFELFGENETLMQELLLQPFRLIDLSTYPDKKIDAWQDASIPSLVFKHGRKMTMDLLKDKILNGESTSENIGDFFNTMLRYSLSVSKLFNKRNFEVFRT